MLNLNRSNFQAHPFHLVSPSPWPHTFYSLPLQSSVRVPNFKTVYECFSYFILILINILINLKWTGLVVLLILRIIKWPVYCLIACLVSDPICMLFLFLFIGAIITYFFYLLVWDPFFKNSPVFKVFDKYILESFFSVGFTFHSFISSKF